MVKINWSEELTGNKPQGQFDLRFCSEGQKFMKYIMTYIMWIETTVEMDVFYKISYSDGDYRIHCSFGTDQTTLRKIHNRFRTLVRKHYRKDK